MGRIWSECRRFQARPGSSSHGAVGIFCTRPSRPLWKIRLNMGGRSCCQLEGICIGHSSCRCCGGGRRSIGSSSWRRSKSLLRLHPQGKLLALLLAAGEQLKKRLRHHCGGGRLRYRDSLFSALEPLQLRREPLSTRCEDASFGRGPWWRSGGAPHWLLLLLLLLLLLRSLLDR